MSNILKYICVHQYRPATLRDRLSPLEAYDFYHRFREGFLLILQSVEPLLKQTNSLEPDTAAFSVAQRLLPLVISRSLAATSQSTVCRLVG